jgi:hypothetical protein
MPLLRGQAPERERVFYWESHEKTFAQAVRVGHLKALRTAPGAAIEVYDLRADPGESRDLAGSQRDFASRAEELFRTERTESEHWPLSVDPTPKKKKKS